VSNRFTLSPAAVRTGVLVALVAATFPAVRAQQQAASPAPASVPAAKPEKKEHFSPVLGKVIASLPVVTMEGNALDIAKEKGWKVVYFWAPMCPCVRNCQRLSLIPLAKAYQAKGVEFYAIASNESNVLLDKRADGTEVSLLHLPAGVGTWPPYPIVSDPRHRAADILSASTTPQTFLLDPQNRVVFTGNPDDSEEILKATGRSGEKKKDYLADALTAALAGKPIPLPISPALGCDIERAQVASAVQK
jgi:hypothetical protein